MPKTPLDARAGGAKAATLAALLLIALIVGFLVWFIATHSETRDPGAQRVGWGKPPASAPAHPSAGHHGQPGGVLGLPDGV